jgi:predicted DNA-binding transcriptional regulator YafY
MRYSRAERLIQLALEMQAARGGLTISDIMNRFAVSRRTAIRMRDAVIRAFPQADEVPSDDRHKRWRLSGTGAQIFMGVTADDLATLEVAGEALAMANLSEHADSIRVLGSKVRSMLNDQAMRQVDPDLEALLEAEGIAHRPGPRPRITADLFEMVRNAIKSCSVIQFDYAPRKGQSQQRSVCPLGLLYGHRHYLVAHDEGGDTIKYFSLPSIKGLKLLNRSFVRDPRFDLKALAAQSFGVFDETPVDVEWHFDAYAAPTAKEYVFHVSQEMEEQADGTLVVRFRAGGQLEMAWHLLTWGNHVRVEKPASLKAMIPAVKTGWSALP